MRYPSGDGGGPIQIESGRRQRRSKKLRTVTAREARRESTGSASREARVRGRRGPEPELVRIFRRFDDDGRISAAEMREFFSCTTMEAEAIVACCYLMSRRRREVTPWSEDCSSRGSGSDEG